MSFILDALKKSEIERQRQTVPGLMDTRTTQRRGGLPAWAIALGVLFGINIIVLAVVLVRSNKSVAPAAPAHETIARGPAKIGADHFSPLDPAPVYAPEVPVMANDDAAANQGPEVHTGPGGAISVNPLHAPAANDVPHVTSVAPLRGDATPRSARRPDPLLTDEALSKDDNDEVLPTINELNLTGSQALQEIHLDVHVYATRPADRFVYINMRKYHEGNTLQEGPVLERIRRDGVVLSYHGLRFVVPRQS